MEVGSHEISAATDASYTFENMPVYSNGKTITYTADELNVATGYEKSIEGMTVTNTHQINKYTVTYYFEYEGYTTEKLYEYKDAYESGDTHTIQPYPSTGTIPDNHVFVETWVDDDGNEYVVDDIITITKDVNLYAKFVTVEQNEQALNFWNDKLQKWDDARSQFDAVVVNSYASNQIFYCKTENGKISLVTTAGTYAIDGTPVNSGTSITLEVGKTYEFIVRPNRIVGTYEHINYNGKDSALIRVTVKSANEAKTSKALSIAPTREAIVETSIDNTIVANSNNKVDLENNSPEIENEILEEEEVIKVEEEMNEEKQEEKEISVKEEETEKNLDISVEEEKTEIKQEVEENNNTINEEVNEEATE